MKTIFFNTGAQYTANGQRITATLHDDGVVTFHDHDRMVTGEFECKDAALFTQGGVLAMYLHNKAPQSRRSHADAFYVGGCNNVFAEKCQWFALCENPPTTTLPHPVLGNVPCCNRCADKITRLQKVTRQ